MSRSGRCRKSQGGSGCYVRVKQVHFLNHKPLKLTNDSSEMKAFISFNTAVEKREENVTNKKKHDLIDTLSYLKIFFGVIGLFVRPKINQKQSENL